MRQIRFIILALVLISPLVARAQQAYTQTGVASYYADKFQGRTTASGERYDKNKLTCAHISLPFGTVLRVTCLDNNRTTVVRVNDRGPFAPDRIIDLSRRAAEALGIISTGTGNVRIEVVASTELVETPDAVAATPPPAAETHSPASASVIPSPEVAAPSAKPLVKTPQAAGGGVAMNGSSETYRVQVAAFSPKGFAVQLASYQGLSNLLRHLNSIDVANIFVYVAGAEPNSVYKIMVGPFTSRTQADKEKLNLEKRFSGCFVVQL